MTVSKPDEKPKRKAPKSAFRPGPDPRRNMAGNLNAAAQSYEIRFRNALADGLPPDEFAAVVIEEVRRHRPGAREFYADRLMGKVTQPVGFAGKDGAIESKLTVEVIHVPGADSGNGNGGNGNGGNGHK